MNKKVSIIIPCYNCEKYVSETLRCLECQTYKNLEIVCVNDGSKDNTLSLLNEWKNKGTMDVRVISQENAGVSAARNRGLQESTGYYIMFCDADDCYHEKMIELLVSGLEKNGADVAYCLFSREPECLKAAAESAQVSVKGQTDFMRDLLYRMGKLGFYCYLYKKDTIVKAGLSFDRNTRHFEDREFNWKYIANCEKAAFVDAQLYWYRQTENSATTTKVIQWRTDGLDAEQRIEKYLEDMGHPFTKELKSYLFQRVVFSSAKNYAAAGAYDLLVRLGREYDVKSCMKVTAHDKNKKVAIASRAYLISPKLFYRIVHFLG